MNIFQKSVRIIREEGIKKFISKTFSGLLRPTRVEGEVANLLKIFIKYREKTIMEISTAGRSILFFCKIYT